MRTVKGFERAGVQWTMIALCVVLIVVSALGALAVRRSAQTVRGLNEEIGDLRTELERLESQVVRERSTREALALELTRQRTSAAGRPESIPTLTLYPVASPNGQAPAHSVTAPPAEQIIELRLVLPEGTTASRDRPLEVVLRDWSSGKPVWSRSGLRAAAFEDRAAVISYVTGDLLKSGSYEVVVRSESGDLVTYEVGVK